MPKSTIGYIFLVQSDHAFLLDYSLNYSARFITLKSATYLDLRFVDFYDLPKSFERDFFNRFQFSHIKNSWYSIGVLPDALAYIAAAVERQKEATRKKTKPTQTPLVGTHRLVYILSHLDLKPLIQSADTLHRHSPELQPLIEFGCNPVHAAKLGFSMPVTTAGRDKGKPDPIRYLGRLLDLYDRRLELVDQPKVNGERRNNYRIVNAN